MTCANASFENNRRLVLDRRLAIIRAELIDAFVDVAALADTSLLEDLTDLVRGLDEFRGRVVR